MTDWQFNHLMFAIYGVGAAVIVPMREWLRWVAWAIYCSMAFAALAGWLHP